MPRVFVIDSSVFERDSLKRLLTHEEGYVLCGEAENATEGIQKILTTKPDIVVISSMGLDVIRALKSAHINLPILVLSSQDEGLHAQDVLYAGAQGYLMKQNARKNLFYAIEHVLMGETYA